MASHQEIILTNSDEDSPRSRSVAYLLSAYNSTISNTVLPTRSASLCRRNRESKIFQHIQLFEGNRRSGNYGGADESLSQTVMDKNEPYYVNLAEVSPDTIPQRRHSESSLPRRKPMPNPRLSVIQQEKIPENSSEEISSEKVLLIPEKTPTQERRASVIPEKSDDAPVILSPRRASVDTPRKLPPPRPPPPPPSRPSNVISAPEIPFSHEKHRRSMTLPVVSPFPGGNFNSASNSHTLPVTTSPRESVIYTHPSMRPLPETPKMPNLIEDNADDFFGEPDYEELVFGRQPEKVDVPVVPVVVKPKEKARQLAKNFRSLRGVPQEFDQPKPKPRASSFTTADLVAFPPRNRFASHPHSTTCSSMSLTESDSGVSLEQESNKDDSSLLYVPHGISFTSSEFQKIVEKAKGFSCRSESLNNNAARVKATPKVTQDRSRRHTLPVSSLSKTVFDDESEDHSEISQYPSRSLWCQRPHVIESGILERLSDDDKKMQEAIYEIICSEASHLRSLNILINVFKTAPELQSGHRASPPGEISVSILTPQEERNLFLNISDIRILSQGMLRKMHERWLNYGEITLPDMSDILEDFAVNHSKPYVNYCSNQLFQDRTLKNLKERKRFQEVIRRLESHPSCELLDFRSYLMLPMQRITRLPLLLTAIIKRLKTTSPAFAKYSNALTAMNKVVKDCDEGAKRCACIEELCRIDAVLQFDVSLKKIPIISAARCLVKRGTVDMIQVEHKLLPRRTYQKKSVHLLLFNDLFMLTRPKSGSEDALIVMDYCARNLLDCLPVSVAERDDLLAHTSISTIFTSPESFRGVKLVLLRNSLQKTVEFFVIMTLESDYMRWMSVLNQSEKVDGEETIYEVWDCPQYEVMSDYMAKENDELSLTAGDVVDIYRKSSDGWMEGRKVTTGQRGWLPTDIARELMTEHARARILKQRNRLLTASAQLMKDRLRSAP